jgi:ribose transport system ATP-binding protein
VSATTPVPPALWTSDLSKTFGDRTVLFPFTMSVEPGEIHALVGQNGSGKSTFIKILSGYHSPDAGGECRVSGESLEFASPQASRRLGLRFVHQDLGLIGTSSILDNLAFTRGYATRGRTIRRSVEHQRAVEALALVDMHNDPRQLVSSLSAAQKTGVAVARAIQGGQEAAKVLVLDEPTATLPAEEVEHLHTMLKGAVSRGLAILYVTHHLDEVFRLAHRVSVLRDGQLVESSAVDQVDRQTIVHRLIGSELEAVHRDRAPQGVARSGERRLDVVGLTTDTIHDVSLSVSAGEIVGVYGLTGSGRESLLGAIFGASPREGGRVNASGKDLPAVKPGAAIAAGVGYLPPDRKASGGFMHLTATENVTMARLRPFWQRGFLRNRAEEFEAQAWFTRLQVSPATGIKAILASFSGGNQQKLILGKWLRLAPHVLLLDEPTQGVDVGAKAELHRQIMQAANSGAGVVVASSDVEELASLCDRVLIMRNGVVTAELEREQVTEAEINRQLLVPIDTH